MENNEKLSAEQSLKIISEAIEQSRNEIMQNAGAPMVFWGALTCVTSIIIWLLWTATDNPSWNALWFLMAITGWSIMTVKMKKQRGRPSNILSKILCVSWISFGLFAMVTAILGTISLNSLHYAGKLPIASVLILPSWTYRHDHRALATQQDNSPTGNNIHLYLKLGTYAPGPV